MFRLLPVVLVAGWLGAGPALAQFGSPAAAPRLTDDAARACQAAHLHAALRQPSATVAHRAKMERYDVKYYKLDIALENNSRNVGGSVWMRARVRPGQALDSLAFELYQAPAGAPAAAGNLLIDSVVVNGRRSPGIRRAGSDATARLAQPVAAGALLDARIYYRGTAPHGSTAAIGNALDTETEATYGVDVTWSLSEPYSAHEWFPCKQVLTDKADSSDVWVTTTLPNRVGSNGVLVRTVPLPGNKARYEWKSRHPIAYYLISVAVAPYSVYTSTTNPIGGFRVPVVNYVYSPQALADFRTEMDRTPGFLENFSTLFGDYPFANEKYGHCTAPIGGGMEHQTMTTQDGFTFTLTAHELCHQWWGDNVTCATWEDIWLNEGFASYGEYLSIQALNTAANARTWMNQAHNIALQSNGSVYVADTANVGRIFSYSTTYKKAGAVVHMLRYLLNDDVKFFRALRTYQRQFAGSTARTADLQRVFEAEAGRPLGYFFQQWYRGRGYPRFDVRWNQVGNTFGMSVNEVVTATAFTPFFDTDVSYRLTFANGTTQTLRLRQAATLQRFTVPVTGTVTSVEVDPDQWILDIPSTPVRDPSLALAARSAAAAPTVAVYPVPCRETLTLTELPSAPGGLRAEVSDATGRVVLRQPLPGARPALDTRALAPGLYQLRLFGADGQALGQARFARE